MKRRHPVSLPISLCLILLCGILLFTCCSSPEANVTTEGSEATATEAATTETKEETVSEEEEPDYTFTESYASRLFVKAKNMGNTRKLTGKILLNFFLISDSQTTWSDYDLRVLKGTHKIALTKMKAEAASYGVTLDVTLNYVPCTVSGTFDRDNDTVYVKEALKSVGYTNPNTVVALLKKEFQVDEVAPLFCYNAPNRSFSYPTANLTGFEYAVLYGRDEDFRHEMYHLFGARDYYIPSQVETLAEFYFPDSVMLYTSGRVDELTAYIIGWRKKISEKGAAFLESCKDLTSEDWTAGYDSDDNHFTGTKTVTLGSGTYTGEFRGGIIFGQGKMVYNNGDVYEGAWQNGLRHGQGTLTRANGEVQSGIWEYDKFKG